MSRYTTACSEFPGCLACTGLCALSPAEAVNPKELRATADGKSPLDYLDPAANEEISYVLRAGAEKYGRNNFRSTPMKLTVYLGAIQRHVDAMKRGETLDADDGRHHLAHIGACAHVTLGALEAGTLVDDTQFRESKPASDAVHIVGDIDAKAGAAPKADACCLNGLYGPNDFQEVTSYCLSCPDKPRT